MLLVFGPGFAGRAIAAAAPMPVVAVSRDGWGDSLRFDDAPAVRAALATATHVVSTVPPGDTSDPVLAAYGAQLAGRWLGYLSSTGVYGDAGGGWVDERTPIRGRRPARNAADAAWLALGARVFRLPGIYGPGRSALDRVAAGTAHRTGIAGQVFSRIHVADLARGVVAGMAAPAGAYNLADDHPASHDAVVAHAAALLGMPPPPIVPLAALGPAARAFYGENRRVSAGKAARLIGWRPRYRDYREGLRAVSAMTSPTPASAPPAIASGFQR